MINPNGISAAGSVGRNRDDVFLVPYVAKSADYDTAERTVDIETVYFVSDLSVEIV